MAKLACAHPTRIKYANSMPNISSIRHCAAENISILYTKLGCFKLTKNILWCSLCRFLRKLQS